MRQLIAANWKMNGTLSWAQKGKALAALLTPQIKANADLLICPPTHIIPALSAQTEGSDVMVGAQNCHAELSGAYTGEMSAAMCADAGADYVIIGHSERREYNNESSADILEKAKAVHKEGLIAIICIGESLEQREAGEAEEITAEQLNASMPDSATSINTVIAYEPIWAIGTGKVPTSQDIAVIHAHLRALLVTRYGAKTANGIHLLYGGSVKPANAAEILALPNVDGALVGGASLEMESFAAIAAAATAA